MIVIQPPNGIEGVVSEKQPNADTNSRGSWRWRRFMKLQSNGNGWFFRDMSIRYGRSHIDIDSIHIDNHIWLVVSTHLKNIWNIWKSVGLSSPIYRTYSKPPTRHSNSFVPSSLFPLWIYQMSAISGPDRRQELLRNPRLIVQLNSSLETKAVGCRKH